MKLIATRYLNRFIDVIALNLKMKTLLNFLYHVVNTKRDLFSRLSEMNDFYLIHVFDITCDHDLSNPR